jgi:succinate-semialdehyde dehydrogenase/glutarate-semialdehyde dehydrogenase
MGRAIPELKDKSLFIQKAYVNGEWVDAKSGKTFEVHGVFLSKNGIEYIN